MKVLGLNGRLVGEAQPAFIIAEMSANHGNDIKKAKELIKVAKECGADCIKLQTYTADTITIDCDNEYFKIDEGLWKNENLYSLYERANTPWEWHKELKEYADSLGIAFFSTPFDKTSVDFLEELEIGFYKVASFELTDIPLIRYIASKGKPMIISTGMATKEEIKDAVQAVRECGNEQVALLRCASAYPAITDEMNLKTIQDMKQYFDVPVGLSDHSEGYLGAVVAVSLGAAIIEKHLCLSRQDNTADSAFSMEPNEFKRMVEAVRDTERAIGKVAYGPTEQELYNLKFRRSLFAVKDIKVGETFTEENVRSIRPSYGLKPKYWEQVAGNKASTDIPFGTPLEARHIVGGIHE